MQNFVRKPAPYNRERAVEYAHTWAFGRNPAYYNFDSAGGDCTSFASQCLYAGCGIMNYTKDVGWYYRTPADRAAAWAGVEFLKNFLAANSGPGPYGSVLPLTEAQPGDLIQLRFNGPVFGHTPFVVAVLSPDPSGILVAAHSFDCDNRPLDSYVFDECRLLHIEGVRYN